MLATTLGHEIEIHWLAQEKIGNGALMGTRRHTLQEIDALKHELSNQQRFGTTAEEVSPIRLKIDILRRDLQMRDIKPNLEYSF